MSSHIARLTNAVAEWLTIGRVGIFLLLIAVPGGVLNYVIGHPKDGNLYGLVEEFYANLSWELTGIAVTILLIDRLYQRAENKREQARLLNQLHSHDHGTVMQALDMLRIYGWLEDGLLVNINLAGANLRRANLRHADLRHAALREADLRHADLRDADLTGADLAGVNLQGALLDGANFAEADVQGGKFAGVSLQEVKGLTDPQLNSLDTLAGAYWPSSMRYDGRFDLRGDERAARHAGYHPSDPTAMARFYQVSLERYLAGRGASVSAFQE
ncbi:MAG: pentapeptide repeat-containing protein [Caldilineaceae bacterium]